MLDIQKGDKVRRPGWDSGIWFKVAKTSQRGDRIFLEGVDTRSNDFPIWVNPNDVEGTDLLIDRSDRVAATEQMFSPGVTLRYYAWLLPERLDVLLFEEGVVFGFKHLADGRRIPYYVNVADDRYTPDKWVKVQPSTYVLVYADGRSETVSGVYEAPDATEAVLLVELKDGTPTILKQRNT